MKIKFNGIVLAGLITTTLLSGCAVSDFENLLISDHQRQEWKKEDALSRQAKIDDEKRIDQQRKKDFELYHTLNELSEQAKINDEKRIDQQRKKDFELYHISEQVKKEQQEQERINAVALQKSIDNQNKQDAARGYKNISINDYQLDVKKMPLGKKLIISGFYEIHGNSQTITQNPTYLRPNQYEIYLLTDDAPREVRKKLIDMQQPVSCGTYRPCMMTVLGQITSCSYSIMGRKIQDTLCLAVDDIRH